MSKVHIESLSRNQMEYAFAKQIGIMLGDDSIVIKNKEGFFSVYHLRRFNVSQDFELLSLVLKDKSKIIDVVQNELIYIATYRGKTAKHEEKSMAMIKAYLLYNADKDSFIDILDEIK